MSAIGPFAIPILAVGAFAATLGWFGYQHMTRTPVAAPQFVVSDPAKSDPPRKEAAGGGAPEAKPARAMPAQEEGKPPQPPAPQPGGAGAASAPPESSQPGASSSAAVAVPAAPVAPAFDVVRVEPTGETVVAGRAAPGASVELLLNGTRQSRVVADPSGLFALVPDPLPPGTHELALQVTNGDGSKIRSPQSVTVVVAANRKDPPLVTITAPGQPAVVLSRPDAPTSVASARPSPDPDKPNGEGSAAGEGAKPAAESAPPAKPRRTVQIVSVETEGAGRLLVAGSAAPAAVVRLYLNDTFIAPASAGQDGRVSFSIERGMQPGSYKVRLDDIDPVSGQVRSRAEVPFEMPQQVASAAAPDEAPASGGPAGKPPAGRLASAGEGPGDPRHAVGSPPPDGSARPGAAVLVPKINTALVSRGDSLWAISKRAYGEGPRYTVIYGANAKQIRDPNLIYPGQVFVLPADNREGDAR